MDATNVLGSGLLFNGLKDCMFPKFNTKHLRPPRVGFPPCPTVSNLSTYRIPEYYFIIGGYIPT
jgi:hypothetical protein